MKRQWITSKYGFTIVEIMLVIVIIGIFVSATSVFNWTPQTNIEKTNRIKYKISDMLRDEALKMSIGRMPIGNGVVSAKTTITIDPVLWILTTYANTGGIIFYTGIFIPPYYDGDRGYTITGVTWWTWATSTTSTRNGSGQIIITPAGITFTGTNITSQNIIVQISVSYGHSVRRITFDRRTGKIITDS